MAEAGKGLRGRSPVPEAGGDPRGICWADADLAGVNVMAAPPIGRVEWVSYNVNRLARLRAPVVSLVFDVAR